MLYILPDSAGDILVVQASECLTQQDYERVFLPQINKQLKPSHSLRVLIYLDHNLDNIEQDSIWNPNTFFQDCDTNIIRMAIVSDSQWHTWGSTFQSPIVKNYKVSEFLTALHWLDESEL